jgi:hypothetical protein
MSRVLRSHRLFVAFALALSTVLAFAQPSRGW